MGFNSGFKGLIYVLYICVLLWLLPQTILQYPTITVTTPNIHSALYCIIVLYSTKRRVFQRRVLRRIYGPTKEKDGTWQIKSNEELNRLTGNKNIINYIKAQRLAWFGHVHRMPDNSMVKKVYEWSPA